MLDLRIAASEVIESFDELDSLLRRDAGSRGVLRAGPWHRRGPLLAGKGGFPGGSRCRNVGHLDADKGPCLGNVGHRHRKGCFNGLRQVTLDGF